MGSRKNNFDVISLVIMKGVRELQTSVIILGLAFIMILFLGNAKVVHAAEVASGEGWTLDDSGTLTILYDIPLNMETYSFEWVPYAEQIKEVIVSEGVTEIPASAFASYDNSAQYSSLQKLTLSSTVKKIGLSAFADTGSLGEINLNEGLTEIGHSAFVGTSITEIKLPSTLIDIGGDAFTYCDKLTSVTIPSNVKSIYNATFYGCTSLTDVTIEEGVESIGHSIFAGCSNLKYVIIPRSVTTIGPAAFTTPGLCVIGYPGTAAEDFVKTDYAKNLGIIFQAEICEQHSFGEWETIKEATCIEIGMQKRICTVCQTEETKETEAKGHIWNAGIVTEEATESTEGLKTYTCTVCGETKTEIIDKLIPAEKEDIKTDSEIANKTTDGDTDVSNTDSSAVKVPKTDGGDSKASNTGNGTVTAPKTGDNTNWFIWIIALTVSGGIATLSVMKQKHKS